MRKVPPSGVCFNYADMFSAIAMHTGWAKDRIELNNYTTLASIGTLASLCGQTITFKTWYAPSQYGTLE